MGKLEWLAWKRSDSSFLSPFLFSVFVDARDAAPDEIANTLQSLDAQIFRNIEVFLLVSPECGIDPSWEARCRTLRGSSYVTDNDQGASDLAKWRGNYGCAVKAGREFDADFFARIAATLGNEDATAVPGAVGVEGEEGFVALARDELADEHDSGLCSLDNFLARFHSARPADLIVSSGQDIEVWIPRYDGKEEEETSERLPPLKRMFRRWKRSVEKRLWNYSLGTGDASSWMLQSGLFDAEWYLRTYSDVRQAGADPLHHYLFHGWKEGRLPSAWFAPEVTRAFGFEGNLPQSPLAIISKLPRQERDDLVERMKAFRVRMDVGPPFQPGVCVIGHLQSVIGLGQAARNLSYAVDAERIPLSLCDAPPASKTDYDGEFQTKCGLVTDRRATIHVFDAVSFVRYIGKTRPGRTDILYPFWELGRLPEGKNRFLGAYDEVWAPSNFVADAFAASGELPVSVLPQPVRIPAMQPYERTGPFRFLAYMDFASFVARKNPEGPVRAFISAFADGRRDVRLCVKVRGVNDAGRRQWLLEAARRDPRIEVIDRTLSREEMDRLIMSCDAFISLHRSEGFGFGPAEALAAGKPVVSTDFSSTTDFVSEETGYPVAYRLVALEPDSYVDWKGQVWAEPDIDDAARALREIVDDPDRAKLKGAQGRRLMIERYSPEAVGRQMRMMLLERDLL
ncbi:glycosyltransferase family 4 protein [Parvibaculum sp. MBR-TMA-1.3b-4.2]|jgi:glycosyltransferase involved in cell wall biosynthesis